MIYIVKNLFNHSVPLIKKKKNLPETPFCPTPFFFNPPLTTECRLCTIYPINVKRTTTPVFSILLGLSTFLWKAYCICSDYYYYYYFFFPPNFVLAINVCFAICRLDFFHIVSYSLCAFKFHPAKPNHFLCKSYLPIHCLSCVCISFVTK